MVEAWDAGREPGAAVGPDPIEAVIISGPRRGEIIQLADGGMETLTEQELQLLNDALDQLLAAVDRYQSGVRATTAAFRAKTEQS